MKPRKWVFSRRLLLIMLTLLVMIVLQVQSQDEATNLAIIMDASGSMQVLMEPSRSRLSIAREAITQLSSELPVSMNTSFWAYGHRLSQQDKTASCQDIEEIIPLGPLDRQQFADSVRNVSAIGYTPIAQSLETVAVSLPRGSNNVIILMSDGEESCGGDPCGAMRALLDSGVDVVINTIGLAADDATRAQLQCIADVTGGTYYDAPDAAALLESFREASVVTTGVVQLVDSNGDPVTDVSFVLLNADGTSAGSAIGSGTFTAGEYTVRVGIEPPFEADVTVNIGETTIVMLPAAGIVQMVDADLNATDAYAFNVWQGDRLLHAVQSSAEIELQPGDYEIRVQTEPEQIESVTVVAGETVQVVVGAPGVVEIVDADGNITEDYRFDVWQGNNVIIGGARGSVELLPGEYDIRVHTDPQTRQDVTIVPGETVQVVVPLPGIVEIVDPDGNLIEDYRFNVWQGDEIVAGQVRESIELLSGTYEIYVQTNPEFIETVTVESGEIVQVVVPIPGVVEIVDAEGNLIEDYRFNVWQGDRVIAAQLLESIALLPGEYEIQVLTDPELRETVTVESGTTVQVIVEPE